MNEISITIGDRAFLRAIHFSNETEVAIKEAAAIKKGDFEQFLRLVRESGDSSYRHLQNIYACGDIKNQRVGIALALSGEILDGSGAYRVHGGGFASTIQAFVPNDKLNER